MEQRTTQTRPTPTNTHEHHSERARKKKKKPSGPGEKSGSFTGELLLVEDNPVNQKIARVFFTALGLNVTVASDGQQAIDIYREKQFDVIFMDLQMPVMDGFDATLWIRRYETARKSKKTPIIALTGNVTDDYRARCFEVGMDDFFEKPLNRKNITERLHEVFKFAAL